MHVAHRVELQHLVPVVGERLVEPVVRLHADIVDQDIELATVLRKGHADNGFDAAVGQARKREGSPDYS